MGQMTNSQARVVDPILTEVARAYSQNSYVGMQLFPRVPVLSRGGKIVTFGKEAFMRYNNIERAPGQNTKRVQFGYAGAPFSLRDYSLEGQVPVETGQEARAVPGIDIAARTVNGVQDIIANRLEIEQATLATTAANYGAGNKITLAGTAQWSDYSGTSHPIADVETAKEVIRQQTGKRPNVMVVSAAAFARLKGHPDIVGRLVYTQREIATPELMASLFGMDKLVIGDSIYSTDAGVFVDSWGKDVVLAYVAPGSLASQGTPSFGYTYQLEGYPDVEEPYHDRNPKSWIYPVTDSVAPVIAGPDSGFLFKSAVA